MIRNRAILCLAVLGASCSGVRPTDPRGPADGMIARRAPADASYGPATTPPSLPHLVEELRAALDRADAERQRIAERLLDTERRLEATLDRLLETEIACAELEALLLRSQIDAIRARRRPARPTR